MAASIPAGSPSDVVPVRERRRYLDVAEEVMRSVAIGSIGVGDRLPNERELAVRCDVSRSTVREALLALELSGVIEVRPGSGCYLTGMGIHSGAVVTPPADSSPRELIEVRQTIEPAVARLCAANMRNEDIHRISRLVDDAATESESLPTGSLDRFVRLGLAFHRELAAVCGNSILAGLTSHLVDAGEHPLWMLVDAIVVRDPDTRTRQVEEHHAILRAIAKGDEVGAAEAMTAHLGAISDRIFGPAKDPPRVTRTRRRRSA
jgi:GntR family uxuAB operon transcriptional repressor